ncbi:MAG: hypothetical protein CMP11_01545 [Zetaproteobacteria bacterium]|nr:hypothetical protein [Pseudobdellovibrionaceae bacterium]
MNELITIEIFSCLMMTGVIWIVQLVHYPSFAYVAQDKFTDFEVFHQKRISLVVLPLMLTEFISHFCLYLMKPYPIFSLESLSTFSLLGIWFVTFFMCVPCHSKLCQMYDKNLLRKLIYYNWLRTFFWSVRSFLFFFTQIN